MNHAGRVKLTALLVVILMVAACKSKQDKPGATSASPQEKAASAPATAFDKAGAPAATPQDMADARATALRVLAQFEAGDFATIYRESGAVFKQIGPEAAFVAKFQQTRQKTGVLGKPKELKFDTRDDHVHVLLYRLENQRYISEMRLSFARSKSGAMELVGLNQHDDPRIQ